MANQIALDNLFLDIAARIADESQSRRLKVGAVIVKNGNILSMGWNGTPSGFDNTCEHIQDDGMLITRSEVIHAESNALLKISHNGGNGAAGGVLYTTDSPCPECAKLVCQAGIRRVVFRRQYRLLDGIEMLKSLGIQVDQFPKL